jgi:hypothetical protein
MKQQHSAVQAAEEYRWSRAPPQLHALTDVLYRPVGIIFIVPQIFILYNYNDW